MKGGIYPIMQWGRGVSQHAIGQGVCIPECNWAGGVKGWSRGWDVGGGVDVGVWGW